MSTLSGQVHSPIFRWFKPIRIFHFRLDEAEGKEKLCAAQSLELEERYAIENS